MRNFASQSDDLHLIITTRFTPNLSSTWSDVDAVLSSQSPSLPPKPVFLGLFVSNYNLSDNEYFLLVTE